MIFTIGYERATPKTLLEALKGVKVKTLIDVRELPASRRPGFSKKALSLALAAEGIAYEHLRGLGTPKEGREANKRGDMKTFWKIVDEQLATAEAKADFERAKELMAHGTVCLLCLEADHETCHRNRVAEKLRKATAEAVTHLHLEFPLP
ncbi:MAG: DUF488 family protein [Myxococcota bacterium]|nr:DUF488 domain-containing protein [Myxococcota bacterium]